MNNFIRKNAFNSALTASIRSIVTSQNIRKQAMEALKDNPFYNKYSDKILEKQKLSPEEFNAFLDEHAQKIRNANEIGTSEEKQVLEPVEAKSKTIATENNLNYNLDKVIKLDLIMGKTKVEIQHIWKEFHKGKECSLSATVPPYIFKIIKEKAKNNPTFLLPLPRNQGYEFLLLQFSGNGVYFTPLISYQAHEVNAPVCLTLIYYPELMDEKDIVLMKGEFDPNVINPIEAQCLANQLQLFYGEYNDKRDAILQRFTCRPDEFNHMDLIAEIECLTL